MVLASVTLALGRYVDPASNDPHHLCFDNALVRPAPGGAAYGRPTPLVPSWCALSMLFSDWSRSGRMDLRVSNDAHYYLPTDGQEQLWRMPPREQPSLYTADGGWVTVQIQGMGIASYDLTGDGYPEVFLTSQSDNRLQMLALGPSQPTYRDIGLKRGVNAAQPFTGGDTRPSTAWHAQFDDVNNDGFVDLFISKGNVTEQPDYAQKDPSDLLLGQSAAAATALSDAKSALGTHAMGKCDFGSRLNYLAAILHYQAGKSAETIRLAHAVLRRALKQAVRWRLIPYNMSADVDRPKVVKADIAPLTADQVARLIEAARDERQRAVVEQPAGFDSPERREDDVRHGHEHRGL